MRLKQRLRAILWGTEGQDFDPDQQEIDESETAMEDCGPPTTPVEEPDRSPTSPMNIAVYAELIVPSRREHGVDITVEGAIPILRDPISAELISFDVRAIRAVTIEWSRTEPPHITIRTNREAFRFVLSRVQTVEEDAWTNLVTRANRVTSGTAPLRDALERWRQALEDRVAARGVLANLPQAQRIVEAAPTARHTVDRPLPRV